MVCTEGSPIRRIGHERWLRNVAVALGNALTAHAAMDTPEALQAADVIKAALRLRLDYPGALVREHVQWALAQHP